MSISLGYVIIWNWAADDAPIIKCIKRSIYQRPGVGGAAHATRSGDLTNSLSCNIMSYMKRDSRLSGALHVLLHLYGAEKPLRSEDLAQAMHTNPVVVRRTMAGLREAGLVRSEKGHGGGWSIAGDVATMTLHDVYAAIGAPDPFALGNRTEAPGCLVEQLVNEALDDAFNEAEVLLLARLGTVSLAALAEQFQSRRAEHTDLQGAGIYDV